MRFLLATVLLYVFLLNCSALNCKSDGGFKEDELKTVYMNCAKRQDNKNSSDVSTRSSWGRDNVGRRGYQEERWSGGRDGGNRGRGDMSQSDEYNRESSRYNNNNNNNNYRTSTQSSKRYKRERRMEMNTSHRSHYNPNTSYKESSYDNNYRREEKNSSDNTDDSGMPDRYMVTNVITKNVKNEDLKEFLQESIEECFQILYNENSQDKCSFSKNLMTCLSEKGKSNCDDWKEDMQF